MNTTNPHSSAVSAPSRTNRGFALIVTLSLMILLTVIAVGLLSLSSISLRSSSSSGNNATARANARMALMLAIGELQKQVGPDQRVTAEAAILENDPVKPISQSRWVGAWNSAGANTAPLPLSSAPKWLVSGSQTTPAPDPANPPADLFIISKNLNSSTGVGVPRQTIATKNATGAATTSGRYAYWVSDEGVKARVNVAAPADSTVASLTTGERIARSVTSQGAALTKAGGEWTNVTAENKSRVISMESSSLVTTGSTIDVPRKYQHDLTCDGYGLPVDVSAGGFKKDLTTIFDDKTLGSKYLGATFAPSTTAATAGKVAFTVTDPTKFYLVDAYAAKGVGPNWGILYNYNDLRGSTSGTLISNQPAVSSNVRIRDWAPYDNSNTKYGTAMYPDSQHTNSQIGPVLSVFRVGFRLSATPSGGKYQLRLHVKPIIGLWNPYNVKLQTNTYTLIWATCSYLKLKIREPDGTIREPRLWLREIAVNTGTAPSGTVPQNYSEMKINNVPFEPGEFRSFSVGSSVVLGNTNELLPKLNGKDAFYSNLTWKGDGSNTPPTGAQASGAMLVPAGSQVSISEMVFDDLQVPETKQRWSTIKDTETTSYFIIRTSAGDLCRFSDMWIRSDGSQPIPGKFVGNFPTKTVETLAANATDPDASWEFRLRTSDQAERPLRNLVDANPRAVIMNPRWDGSTDTKGWWFSSPYCGGGPNQTGLVIDPAFQSTTSGSFNHFGGNSSDASGQTRVAAYEVPRGSLASLAQFQHAQLSRYNFEPSFVVGNSQASMRMPLGETVVSNYAGIPNFILADTSYHINRKLWDGYFLSTLSGSFKGGTATADSTYPLDTVKFSQRLPNPRNMVIPLPGDKQYAGIKSKSTYPAEAIASRIGVVGAFNVNSTSEIAWKTLLASLTSSEFPTVSATGLTWNQGGETRFSHLATPVDALGSNQDASEKAFWLSYRKLSDAELDSLATEIVKEVKARGPFRSLAGFINRNPNAASAEHQRKGALQAALDKVLNGPLQAAGDLANIPGMNNDAFDSNEKQAAGNTGYVSQADVLQTIGPVIQARSDCFRVRAMGQVMSPDGKTVVAQAVCEAYVQREASYLDPANAAEIPSGDPLDPAKPNPVLSTINQTFGRNMKVTSFRWLQTSEI